MAHERDQQIQKPRDSICSNRLHLANAAMRPYNNSTVFTQHLKAYDTEALVASG